MIEKGMRVHLPLDPTVYNIESLCHNQGYFATQRLRITSADDEKLQLSENSQKLLKSSHKEQCL